MVKLADTPDLGSGTVRCVGSSPILGTFTVTVTVTVTDTDTENNGNGIGHGIGNGNKGNLLYVVNGTLDTGSNFAAAKSQRPRPARQTRAK